MSLARWLDRRRAELRERRADVVGLERTIREVERRQIHDAEQADRVLEVTRSIAATADVPFLAPSSMPSSEGGQ